MPISREERAKRKPYIVGDICYIPMAGGRMALCDAKDYDIVSEHLWHLDKHIPYTTIDNKEDISLSQMLGRPNMNYKYINGNQFDCRKENMEPKQKYPYMKNGLCYIPLSSGDEAICDIDKFDLIKNYFWYRAREDSAATKIKNKTIYLVKMLFPEVNIAININKNKLDCRSANIRDKRRECVLNGDICITYTSHGDKIICDASDFEKVRKYSWNRGTNEKSKNFKWAYPVAGVNGKRMTIHKYLFPEIKHADHINRNIFDNRRCNIREAGEFGNAWNQGVGSRNKTGYKGVAKRLKRYQACIAIKHKRITIGTFDTPEQAAKAYDAYAKEYFGEFAFLNFPNMENE